MSVLDALYRTYNYALNNNMADQAKMLNQNAVLLPVFHTNKRSNGSNDIIEITLSETGEFIKAEWMPKDQIIIFPVTENSITRSGKVIAPHPLCDELSYLASEIDSDKHLEYLKVLNNWFSYMEKENENRLLRILHGYILQDTIFEDCIKSLFAGSNYIVNNDFSILLNSGDHAEKIIRMEKVFVTFQIEVKASTEANLSVSTDRDIHINYIDYIRGKNSEQPQEQCDISGERTYCVSRHRGLMGNSKLISISNHNETYYGRFVNGEEIVHIGYETSQKVHLMLKYLMENSQNRKRFDDSCILINWFSDDINNDEHISLTSNISPYDDLLDEDMEDDEGYATLGDSASSAVNDYILGKRIDINIDGKFYVMILDKISNGRISVKYFRELPKSDLFERVDDWYHSTNWMYYSKEKGRYIIQTPSLFRLTDTIFGIENEKGFVECKESKLRTKTIERLIPCIIDHKKLPQDLKNRMLHNICNRSSYDKSWNSVLAVACSIFKKYQLDYLNKRKVSEMLDTSTLNISYLYGRLLAVYEKLEQDALKSGASGNDEKRTTNAERLWTAYTKMPGRTLRILEEKIRPYKDRLKKNRYGTAIYYDKLLTEILNQLNGTESFGQKKNRALDENFVFGYYAQKQDLYRKQENKKEDDNEDQNDGGNE